MATGASVSCRRTTPLIPPGLTWLTVFLPALSYFLATRLHFFDSHASSSGSDLFTSNLQLLDSTFQDVVASVWKHDSELGRGYLLLSQSRDGGRLWRWERGGGPIPIGKTLAMDPSGCRSKAVCGHVDGSGGLAVDFSQHDHYREGSLVVAEWGEGRVVRLEDATGARTPLVIQGPVERPTSMLYTPFGDLLFLVDTKVMVLKQAVHVPPLKSAMESRMAHKWNETHHDHPINVLYENDELGSMALDATGMGLYVTVRQNDSVLLVHLSLLEDDEDDEENAKDSGTARVVFNLTDANVKVPPRAMAVDDKNHVFVESGGTGILVLRKGRILERLDTPTATITSLTLGEDGYLYMTTASELYRVRVRHGPPKIPTNLVKKLKHAS